MAKNHLTCKGNIHGHEFVGMVCTVCRITREELNEQFRNAGPMKEEPNMMDTALDRITSNVLQPNTHIHSAEHAAADEISAGFGERQHFGRYLGIIKRLGTYHAYQIYSGIRHSHPPPKNEAAVFFYQAKKILNNRKTYVSDQTPQTHERTL